MNQVKSAPFLESSRNYDSSILIRDLFAGVKTASHVREDPQQALQAAITGDKRLKLQYFRRRVVLFPAFDAALGTARFLIRQSEFLDEPGGLMILA